MVRSSHQMVEPNHRGGLLGLLASGLAVVALGAAGCGGGAAGSGRDAVELTKWLPAGAASYTAIDLAAYKEELDLPEQTNPWTGRLGYAGSAPFDILMPSVTVHETETVGPGEGISDSELKGPSAKILNAVEPADVTAAATSTSDGGNDAVRIGVYATTADTGEVGSALGDLGYRDDGGVLVRGDDDPAVLLEDGLVFASNEAGALRAIPDEPADELPLEVFGRLEGDSMVGSGFRHECVVESGVAASPAGAGEIGFLIDGGADPARVSPQDALDGEPEVDGGFAIAAIDTDAEFDDAMDLQAVLMPGYDCG